MKHRRFWPLLICILLAGMLCAPVLAGDYPEYREPPQLPEGGPTFTEEPVSCVSRGNTLRGVLTLPEGDGPFPMAILTHGLATDHRWCDDIAWALADHGVASVRFDFAGTGASDGAQEDMTISSEVYDVAAILDFVEAQDYTDRGNIIMVGKSMGGVDVLLASLGRQDQVKALVLWYPGFSVTELARRGFLLGQPFFPFDPPDSITVSGYTFGQAFIREAQAMDWEDACRRYQNPVLILHGDRDIVTPLPASIVASQTFPDCRLTVIPGGMHGFFGFQELYALGEMLDFVLEQID